MSIWVPHTKRNVISRINHGGRTKTNFVVIHVNDGSTAGTFSWWAQAGHEADGAHLQVSRSGTAYQCAPLEALCWHAGNANDESVGIEHEGWHYYSRDQWMRGPQLHASADRCAWILHEYGLGRPRLKTNIFGHGMGGVDWGGHANCPGAHFPWDHYLALVEHAYTHHWGR